MNDSLTAAESALAQAANKLNVAVDGLTADIERRRRAKSEQLDRMEPEPSARVRAGQYGGDHRGERFYRTGERLFGPEVEAFDNYFRTKGREVERNALVVAQDEAGGYTVPNAIHAAMVRDARAQSVVARAGSPSIVTASDSLTFVRFVGAEPEWAPEVPPATPSTMPNVAASTAIVKKLRFLGVLSEQLAQDSAVDVTSEVVSYVADLVAFYRDQGILVGSGIGNQPLGIVTSDETPSESVDLGDPASVIAWFAKFPTRFMDGSVVLMNGDTLGTLQGVQAVPDGRPYWDGLFRKEREILSYPVLISDWMPDDTLLLGNFRRGHVTVPKFAGLSIRILTEMLAAQDLIAFRVIDRVGHVVTLPEAFLIGDGS
jgi:HK97 family phage major capsid protein